MKTIKLTIFILLNLFMHVSLQAQVTGYGSGTLQPDPNWNSGLHYMDDVRAKVNSITTGCSSITDNNIVQIFPQPAFNTLNFRVQGTSTNEINCTIYDMSGKMVLKTRVKNTGQKGNYVLDVSSLNSGAYLLELDNVNIKIRFTIMN
jgi:flagella basal body P-ring formation protein FlgA